jgi:hypothetical protein
VHQMMRMMGRMRRSGSVSNSQARIVGHLSLHESTHPCPLSV